MGSSELYRKSLNHRLSEISAPSNKHPYNRPSNPARLTLLVFPFLRLFKSLIIQESTGCRPNLSVCCFQSKMLKLFPNRFLWLNRQGSVFSHVVRVEKIKLAPPLLLFKWCVIGEKIICDALFDTKFRVMHIKYSTDPPPTHPFATLCIDLVSKYPILSPLFITKRFTSVPYLLVATQV